LDYRTRHGSQSVLSPKFISVPGTEADKMSQ
jgi:hypothetical protein